ncbi:MAG: cupin domain-containing protein [Rhodothermaceae bacterium]|nr:cupin domain-containing protein [Rhodothermaceae bacterium]
MKNNSKIIRAHNYTWEGVGRKQYKTDGTAFRDIERFSLLGEGEGELELNCQTRYFEVQPGGYSSLEYHRHPHTVVIIRGSGSMVLGDEVHELNMHDVVYVSPETLHQFHADRGEPLGFLCVVDRYRDKPTVPDPDQAESMLRGTPAEKKARL